MAHNSWKSSVSKHLGSIKRTSGIITAFISFIESLIKQGPTWLKSKVQVLFREQTPGQETPRCPPTPLPALALWLLFPTLQDACTPCFNCWLSLSARIPLMHITPVRIPGKQDPFFLLSEVTVPRYFSY